MHIRSAIVLLCALLPSSASNAQSGFITVTSQPANVGDAGIAARRYHDSGAYQRGLQVVAGQAASWIKKRAPSAQRPALVLDIANMGDQPSDLLGGHAENKFLLPDPFYRVP